MLERAQGSDAGDECARGVAGGVAVESSIPQQNAIADQVCIPAPVLPEVSWRNGGKRAAVDTDAHLASVIFRLKRVTVLERQRQSAALGHGVSGTVQAGIIRLAAAVVAAVGLPHPGRVIEPWPRHIPNRFDREPAVRRVEVFDHKWHACRGDRAQLVGGLLNEQQVRVRIHDGGKILAGQIRQVGRGSRVGRLPPRDHHPVAATMFLSKASTP